MDLTKILDKMDIWNRFQKSARPQLMCINYENFTIAARATFAR